MGGPNTHMRRQRLYIFNKILLLDGSQTQSLDAENPAHIADELRVMGVSLVVVGVGPGWFS